MLGFSFFFFEFMPDVCRYNILLFFCSRLVAAAVESSKEVRQNNDWISMWVSVYSRVVRKKNVWCLFICCCCFFWFGGNFAPFTQFFSCDLWDLRSHTTRVGVCVCVWCWFFSDYFFALDFVFGWSIFSGFCFVLLWLAHSLTVSNKRSWCFCAISLSFSFTAVYWQPTIFQPALLIHVFFSLFSSLARFYVFAVVLRFCLPKRKR